MITVDEKKGYSVSPYDDSMWDHNSMYDKMPYEWNSDLNVEKVFALESGNVIKAYRCIIDKPYEVKH